MSGAGDPAGLWASVPQPVSPVPPISAQPYPGQPYPTQPYSGQPYSGQAYPGQPYAGQPYPGPYAGQPYPGPYQGYPGYPPMVQRRGTNGFAVAALVCGIVFNILGIVFGVIALDQIKRTGEEGRGLALAGIWVGAASLGLTVIWLIFIFVFFDSFMRNAPGLQ